MDQQQVNKKDDLSISLSIGHISKMTYIDDDSQQQSEKQEKDVEKTIQTQTYKTSGNINSQFVNKSINNQIQNFSPEKSLNKQQKRQNFSKQKKQLQNYLKRSQRKLNIGRGIAQMQTSLMVNNISLNRGLLNNNDEIDYNQFQSIISKNKPVKQYFVVNTSRKPKQFCEESINKDANFQIKDNQKQNNSSILSSALVDFDLDNEQRIPLQQENSRNSNFSIMNNFQQYHHKIQNESQDNNQQKQEQKQSKIIEQLIKKKQQPNQVPKKVQNSSLSKNPQNKHQILFQPDQDYVKNGIELAEKITSTGILGDLIRFLIDPIPHNVRMEFQIIRVNKILQTSYQFWIILPGRKNRLMVGQSNSINIQSTIFHLLLGIDNDIKINLATMNSDFRRQQFYLNSNEVKQPKVLAAISTKISINTKKRMQMYIPILTQEKNKFKPMFKNRISNNMRKLYQMSSFKNQIDKLHSVAIHLKDWNTMMNKYQIKISKRNIIMANHSQEYIFFMGKTQKDHYYLPCLGGLSPVQLFSFAIFQLFK